MNFSKTKKVNKTAAWSLLAIYFLTLLPNIHNHDAHEHEHHHQDKNHISLTQHLELSSDCHNAVYHGMQESCGHDHFSSSLETCFSCQFLLNDKTELRPAIVKVVEQLLYADNTFSKNYSALQRAFYSTYVRGPPTL